MEGEIIKTVKPSGIIARITLWQEIHSKRFHRRLKKIGKKFEARRQYVRERDAKDSQR